ncbi:PrsW family intramembrane metalloprotease [Demequina sp. NBRC 110056]|uniref:PrsW family intramembrane metalloprotease n=1 Tax=Demequina sp. NBRC 110056 TaxID=1570345 RepID=UPI0009FDF3F1|nr:PrsW family glutamic-type intramembrane protease [Demequina sp. NBRC 110056]
MFDLRNPFVWVSGILTFVGAIGLLPVMLGALLASPVGFATAMVLWSLYGWALFLLVRRIFRARERPRGPAIAAVVWGGIIVAGVGTWVTNAAHALVSDVVSDDGWAQAIAAGLSEEPLKLIAVAVLASIPATRMTEPLDFVYYGLLVGLGFAVTESILYSSEAAASGNPILVVILMLVLRGVISGLWSHPTYTGISSAGLGYAMRGKGSPAVRWLVAAGALVLVIALHAFFDSPLFDSNEVLGSIIKGLPALAVLVIAWLLARRASTRAVQPAPSDAT